MKCEICGKTTDWDHSTAAMYFCTCDNCFNRLVNRNHDEVSDIVIRQILFDIGEIKRGIVRDIDY